MSKLPSFQFYPGDWLKDPSLRLCSPGARGIWIDVICLMFESEKRGFLITNGRPWTLEQVAVALSGDWQENLTYLKELISNGVMKRVEGRELKRLFPGCLLAYFCHRIVRDSAKRDKWRGQKQRQRVENKQSLSTHLSTPSSSSSSSSILKTKDNERTATEPGTTMFPALFVLDAEMIAFAAAEGVVDADREFNAFRDHHRARATLSGDWRAQWRSWVRKSKQFQQRGNGNGKTSESFAERNIRRAQDELGEVSRRAEQVLSEVASRLPEPSGKQGSAGGLPRSAAGIKPIAN